MLKMVDGTGIIGVDMICPLGISTPQPPNYDKVELEGAGMLALPNSLDAPLERLELGGKTEQVQTTGKNLFDFEKVVVGLINFTDGSLSNVYYKYFTTDYIAIESGDYIISNNNNVGIQSYALYDINSKAYISGKAGNNKVNTLEKCFIRISFSTKPETDISSDPVSYAKKCDIQLEKGTTATPHEPYTGGKPSPSPEYPQEIKSVGKWNGETQKYEVDVQVCNSGYLQKGSYADKIRAFPLEKGKTYRIRVNRNSAVVNAFILNEEKAFKNSAELYATCNHAGLTNVNDTGIVEGKCKIPQLLYSGYTFTVTVGGLFLYQGVNNSRLNTDDAYVVYDFIKTVNENQPYVEQTLTITSDHPITKWDRLVEQGGQIGWLYATKKHVVTGSEQFIDGGVNYYTGSSVDLYFNVMDATGSQGIVKNLSDVPSIWHNKDAEGFRVNGSQFHIRLKNTRLSVSDDATKDEKIAAYKTYLVGEHEKGTPYEIVYQSLEPEFVPLPQSEQNAIRALKTYYPTTVITADGGELDPDIKVTYRKEI